MPEKKAFYREADVGLAHDCAHVQKVGNRREMSSGAPQRVRRPLIGRWLDPDLGPVERKARWTARSRR